MEIINVPISEIVPYSQNARKNTKAIPIVKKSITENGFTNPILLDGKNVIVAGHTRFFACSELIKEGKSLITIKDSKGNETQFDLTNPPCIYVDWMTPEKIKAYRILDNKSNEYAEWDFELLNSELKELQDLNIDLDITGFSKIKLNRIISYPAKGIFKDKQISVVFGNNWVDTHVYVDGKELNNVQFVGVKHRVGGLPTLVIELIAIPNK